MPRWSRSVPFAGNLARPRVRSPLSVFRSRSRLLIKHPVDLQPSNDSRVWKTSPVCWHATAVMLTWSGLHPHCQGCIPIHMIRVASSLTWLVLRPSLHSQGCVASYMVRVACFHTWSGLRLSSHGQGCVPPHMIRIAPLLTWSWYCNLPWSGLRLSSNDQV